MYKLLELPYAFDALEPYIDAKTMEIHYTKHHKTYVDNLNAAIEKYPELNRISLEELLKDLSKVPQEIRKDIQDNGGGHENHSMFWQIMTKNAQLQPTGHLLNEIKKIWGSFEQFKNEFSLAAKKVFGSGWAWFALNSTGKPLIVSTPNQNNPISEGLLPIFGLDVWEHAYYLKYQNKRVDYIQAWWNVINWPYIEEIFNKNF